MIPRSTVVTFNRSRESVKASNKETLLHSMPEIDYAPAIHADDSSDNLEQ